MLAIETSRGVGEDRVNITGNVNGGEWALVNGLMLEHCIPETQS